MRGSALAWLLLVPLAAPGCLDAAGDCAGRASGNAPPSQVFAGSEGAVLARVSAAFGEPLTGGRDGAQHASARGHWSVGDAGGRVTSVHFLGTGEAWLNESIVLAGMDALGLDAATMRREDGASSGFSVRYWQTFQGAPLGSVDASSLADQVSPGASHGHFTSIELHGLRDLSQAAATVGNDTAVARAGAFLECDGMGGYKLDRDHVGLGVFSDSIVRQVAATKPAPGEHCDPTGGFVAVDAVTGQPLGFQPWGCA